MPEEVTNQPPPEEQAPLVEPPIAVPPPTEIQPEAVIPEPPVPEPQAPLVDPFLGVDQPPPSSFNVNGPIPNTVANNPVFITRIIEGIEKKFKIGGKHFQIDGVDYTDVELALPEQGYLIDRWIENKSGVLREVFE